MAGVDRMCSKIKKCKQSSCTCNKTILYYKTLSELSPFRLKKKEIRSLHESDVFLSPITLNQLRKFTSAVTRDRSQWKNIPLATCSNIICAFHKHASSFHWKIQTKQHVTRGGEVAATKH